MDCILIRPPFDKTGFDQDYQESLGIGYLAASLRERNYKVTIIDGELCDYSVTDIIEIINTLKPCVVGLSIMSCYALDSASQIVTDIKNIHGKTIHCTAGGYLPSFMPEILFKEIEKLDSIIRYYGEHTICELVENIKSQKIETTAGVLLNSRQYPDTQYIPIAVKHKIIDTLPFPARDCLQAALDKELPATISSTRGCSGSCTFCATSTFCRQNYGEPVQFRSPDNVVDELEYIYTNFGVQTIHFIDDDFIGNKEQGLIRAQKIAQLIIGKNLPLHFYIECRPDHIDYDTVKLLKQAGLKGIFLGIDSAVERTRKLYNKRCSMEQVILAIKLIEQLKLQLSCGFIAFHPLVSFTEIQEEIQFLIKYNLDTIHTLLNRLYCSPESPITKKLYKNGVLTKNNNFDYTYTFCDNNVATFYEIASTVIKPFFPCWYSAFRSLHYYQNYYYAHDTQQDKYLHYKEIIDNYNKEIRKIIKNIFDYIKNQNNEDILQFTRKQKLKLKSLQQRQAT